MNLSLVFSYKFFNEESPLYFCFHLSKVLLAMEYFLQTLAMELPGSSASARICMILSGGYFVGFITIPYFSEILHKITLFDIPKNGRQVSMITIFDIKNEDLTRLNPQEAVDFFRELLWAEARRIGIEISKIHVSSWINVPDGGVDAIVEGNIATVHSDLIKPTLTCYQIKASESFKPWQNVQVKKELFGEKDPSRENLGESIKDCFDKDGTYILVCFKQDLTAEQHRKAVKILKNYFIQCGYQNPKIEVWSQNNLIGFFQRFPSLALKINQRWRTKFQTHKSWSQQDAEMRRVLKIGQPQKEFIVNMQDALRKNDKAVHIRVWGEPGIGKTRLVLEATRAEDLQPLVIYCDTPSKFKDSELMNEVLKDDNQFSMILVIDECDPDSRSYIWDKLKYRGPRIKLITIYNDHDETSGDIYYLNVPPLDSEHISAIIQEYGIPKDQADRWVEFCSGSPRVAHVFGQNLKENPEDLLKSPDTVNVWNRYIAGYDDPNSDRIRQRRLVLCHIALFKKFGYGRSLIKEAQTISKIVEKADSQITWARFQEIIKDLRNRKILQGEYTLYITPKALHIKLWTDWWNTYGEGFDFEQFIKNLPDSLRNWFYEMFKYASESEVASRITKELLGKEGPFQKKNYLTEEGAKFFLALAEADPKLALHCLKNTIGKWSKEELLRFTTGRRNVVWALEKIAMWRDLFADAARLLLALGEAENEAWANNASGVFVQLFSPAPGKIAPTEASPQERFPILKEALESHSKERRLLGLRACDQALESQHFVRTIGAEYQGLRKTPQLWTPKTYGELFDAYQQVWRMLCERLDELPGDEQQEAINILLNRAQGLGQIQNLADMVIDTLDELRKKPYVDSKRVLSEVIRILHYDGEELPPRIRQRWEQLKQELTGNDFSSLMKRYVGINLLVDEFDKKGNRKDQTQSQIEELAKQAVENHELLIPELDWLTTSEAQNGYRFGYELGKRDKNFSLLPMLLEAQRRADKDESVYFLGGYFRALFERDQERWEKQLDALVEDKKLNVWIPEITWRSGMCDRAALRILNLAKKGMIGISHFKMFCVGSVIQNLSEGIFKKWIEFLLESSEAYAISIALDLYHSYYLHKKSSHILPKDLTFKLLTHQLLFKKSEKYRPSQMDEYHWTEIGKAFIQLYPKKSLEVANKMLEHFGQDGTIFEGFHSQVQAVLNEIVKLFPSEVWKKITKYLGPPIDSRAFHIEEWLRGGKFFEEKEGALALIPQKEIWKWVDEDIESRAWHLATFVPKMLSHGKECLARELLLRYGDREDVRRNLIANFSTEGWTGPASLHYQKKKQFLLDFKKEENNQNVITWIDEYVSILDKEIERAKIKEEREEFR